jgi:hypothetical protein
MVWVFKTTIKNKVQVRKISPILDELILPQGKWNFDLEDCDKILRIENLKTELDESCVLNKLNALGIKVEVLD